MKIYVLAADMLDHLTEQADPMVVPDDVIRSRDNLARWLARYSEARGCEAILVFDGAPEGLVLPPAEHFGKATVVNVPDDGEAWREVAGPANRAAAVERPLVVATDWKLLQALAGGNALVLSPAQFLGRVRQAIHKTDEVLYNEPDEKFSGLAEDEVDFWMNYFDEQD